MNDTAAKFYTAKSVQQDRKNYQTRACCSSAAARWARHTPRPWLAPESVFCESLTAILSNSPICRDRRFFPKPTHDTTAESRRREKSESAKINSEIEVEAVIADVNHSNIENLIENVDLVLDGTDNFQIRYLINDACIKHNKTWIYGAAVSSYGTTMTIIPHQTPCLRCIFEEMPSAGSAPTCDTAGVIQPIITSVSAIQTTEALKILTGNTAALHKSLINIDVWRNDWRKIKLGKPNPDCETCSKGNFEFLDAENTEFFTAMCGRDAVQIRPAGRASEIDLPTLAAKLQNLGEIKLNEYLLRLKIEDYELTVFKDARAIIRGTDDITTARSIYAKYIGI